MFYTNKNKKYGAGTYYDMRTHKATPSKIIILLADDIHGR